MGEQDGGSGDREGLRDAAGVLTGLSPEQRAELERHQYVRSGDDLVWIEPEGVVRRERFDRLYYVRTKRGVFRVSRISREVIEV